MKKLIILMTIFVGTMLSANAGLVDKALKQWRIWCPVTSGNLQCLNEEASVITEINWDNAIWGEDATIGDTNATTLKEHAGDDYQKWTSSAEKDFFEALTPKKGKLKRASSKEEAEILIRVNIDKCDFNYNWGKGGHQLYVWGSIEIINPKTEETIATLNIDNFQGTGGGTSRDRGFKRAFGKYGLGAGLLLMAEYENDKTTY